jgi:hypothetical protein
MVGVFPGFAACASLLFSLAGAPAWAAEDAADAAGAEVDFTGNIEAEGRYFLQDSAHPGPSRQNISLAGEAKLDVYWKDGDSIFTIAPFVRLDGADGKRTHFDLREAKWVGVFDPFEISIGIDKVFWGVTESAHLVDIINQDDALEDIDAEDKLGQPMLAVTFDAGSGLLTGYILPWFRERRFPGADGRPAGPLAVDRSQTIFQSGDNNWHADWAMRWSQYVGAFDFAVSYFSGTARDPRFQLGLGASGEPVLVPRYDLIDQAGLELQGTFGALLVKGEAIHQWNDQDDFFAFAGGFEYSFYGIRGGSGDLGVLAEILYDDRGASADNPFEGDIFLGARWAANDVAGTTILAGGIFDLNSSSKLVNIEASRRLGDDWKITLDARFFFNVAAADPLLPFADDDFLQLRIARFF